MAKRETWLQRNSHVVLVSFIVILLVALPIVGAYWMAPTIFSENRNSGEEIARDSLDSDKAVQDYRWFRSQWYAIQEQHEQTENYRDEHDRFHNQTWPDGEWREHRDARTRHGRIHDRITGSENQEEMLIAEYNARQSDATRAIFQCGLPYSIDEKLFIADASGVEYTSQEAKKQTPPEDPADCQFAQNPEEARQ